MPNCTNPCVKYVSMCLPLGTNLNEGTQPGKGNNWTWNMGGGVCPAGELALICPSLAVSGEGGEGGQSGRTAGGGRDEQLSLFGRLIAEALNLVKAVQGERDIFAALKTYREWRAASVAVRLDLGSDTYVGTNLARDNPVIPGTWRDFVQHAEGDAFSQALRSGTNYEGESGTLYVSRLVGRGPCRLTCVPGISTVARQMGLSELTVLTPEGLFGTYTPETGLVLAKP